MKIDEVSKQVIRLALYLDNLIPGSVSELWIDKKSEEEIRKSLDDNFDLSSAIGETNTAINQIKDKRRRKYLEEIVSSLEFQIQNKDKKISFSDFSENTYGYRIERVCENDLDKIEKKIRLYESNIGKTRFDMFEEFKVKKEKYGSLFLEKIQESKEKIPSYILDFPDDGFEFETTSNKPWSAFNSHVAPFKSQLTLNIDIDFSSLDLTRLSYHEAYGGHHSELSQKDKLLVNEGRGEHGLVITFSPQTFISESIAEGFFVLLDFLDKNNDQQMLSWYYDRLIFALQNLATFLFFDDNLSRDEINKILSRYGITEKTRMDILNFSTDKVFGKYAPVYFTAFDFLCEIYEKSNNKNELLKNLFTKPCTPKLLLDKKY